MLARAAVCYGPGPAFPSRRMAGSRPLQEQGGVRYVGHAPVSPPRWGLLWLFSCLAVLSHIFLDWTNNYGVRPFFPFNPRWYSLDIAFILEPVILAALLLGLLFPAIFGLADRE